MDLKRIDSALETYRDTLADGDKARVNMFRALWGIMGRTSSYAQRDFGVPSQDEMTQDIIAGQPFMANHPIAVDMESLADIVELLMACVLDSGAYPDDVCKAMRALNVRQLVLVSDEDLASVDPEQYLNSLVEAMKTYGVDGFQVTLLAGLVSLGLRALIEPAAEALMRAVPAGVQCTQHSSNCPVCGGRPTLSVLRKTQSANSTGRTLACIQCGTEWEYDRFRCPHCGTSDIKKLGYRSLQDDERHRIEYCDACGNYLRTVVIPDANTAYSIDVEDVVMAAMDSYIEMQAQQD